MSIARSLARSAAPAALLALASVARAGTITDGNASLNLLGPVVFSAPLGDGAFFTDPTMPDQLYKYCWYYRSETGAGNYLFSGLDTPAQSYAANTADIAYRNAGPGVSGFARFDADLDISVIDSPAPNTARVISAVKFTALASNSGSRTYRVFHLVDLDLAGGSPNTAPDDAAAVIAPGLVRFTETSTSSFAEVRADGNPRIQVANGYALRQRINNTPNDLENASSYAGDAAVAFEWIFTLAPGQSITLRTGFAFNQPAVTVTPCPADLNNDHFVDDTDFVLFAQAYDAFACLGDCPADFNADGFVDDTDFVLFAQAYDTFACP